MTRLNRVPTLVALLCASVCTIVRAQPQPIRAPRALEVGDKFRMEGEIKSTKKRHVVAGTAPQPDLDLTTSLEYIYDAEVLEVSDGWPTRQRCKLKRLVNDSGAGKISMLGAPPVVIASLDAEGFTKIEVEEGVLSDEALAVLYDVIRLEKRKVTPAMLAESVQPRSVGESWNIDKNLAAAFLAERSLDVEPSRLTATARLASTQKASSTVRQKIEIKIEADGLKMTGVVPDTLRLTKSSLTAELSVVLPEDAGKLVLGLTSDMTVKYSAAGGQGSIAVSAEHTAVIHETWNRTMLSR